ncbi:MAG: hypothetical protein IJ741_10825 [Schwartzia sp.]|nr:hypothetical protein [Schwartzia sp. (in: firmicutes)]
MSFKYINPGYAELLDVQGGTTVTDATKSKTGICFYQPTDKKGLTLAETPTGLYGKFDVYIGNDYNSFSTKIVLLRSNGYTENGIGFVKSSNAMYFMRYYNGNSSVGTKAYISSPETLNLKLDAVNTFWFRVATGSEGYLEIYSNGVSVEKYDFAIDFATSLTLVVYASNSNGAISNLILSDTEIHKKEQVVILPISNTETTMTAGEDGKYIAGADGQILLQAVDTASLIAEYGADSDINGIAVIGNPAYRTAEGLANLTALSHDGTAITEFGTKIAPQSTSGMVGIGKVMSMKLPALANYKFGWKAGVSS